MVSQTLLFTLILPVTALLAHAWLAEPQPPRFGLTLLLLPGGLAISRSTAGAAQPGADLDPRGLVWALVAVAAFAGAGVLNRLVARRSWGLGLTLGLTNLAAALVFGSLALALFGPDHFPHMRLWWLVGVLVVYSGVINLGGDLALLASYRGLGAIAVALWGNAAVLVALASAHLAAGGGDRSAHPRGGSPDPGGVAGVAALGEQRRLAAAEGRPVGDHGYRGMVLQPAGGEVGCRGRGEHPLQHLGLRRTGDHQQDAVGREDLRQPERDSA